MVLFLREEEVGQLLPMSEAVPLVEDAFRRHGLGEAVNQPRSRLHLPAGTLHLMASGIAGAAIGYKSYTGFRADDGAKLASHVMLYSGETGELLAMLEANTLGQMRTGAASGVATDHLAQADAATVGMIGAGFQARSQLEAICQVRAIRSARVFSRSEAHRRQFCDWARETLQIEAVPLADPQAAVEGVDVISVITRSNEPVLSAAGLPAGVHINAAGGVSFARRELDLSVIERCDVLVVDSLEQAKMDCGDLLLAVERGLVRWEGVHELGRVVAGHAPGRQRPEQVTLFESQGIALEDIAVAHWVYERAVAQGVGTRLPIDGHNRHIGRD